MTNRGKLTARKLSSGADPKSAPRKMRFLDPTLLTSMLPGMASKRWVSGISPTNRLAVPRLML
jgi:hypothetical protein